MDGLPDLPKLLRNPKKIKFVYLIVVVIYLGEDWGWDELWARGLGALIWWGGDRRGLAHTTIGRYLVKFKLLFGFPVMIYGKNLLVHGMSNRAVFSL